MRIINVYYKNKLNFEENRNWKAVISEDVNQEKENTFIIKPIDNYSFQSYVKKGKTKVSYFINDILMFFEYYINGAFLNDDGPRVVFVSESYYLKELYHTSYQKEEYCFVPNGKTYNDLNLYTKEDIENFLILE